MIAREDNLPYEVRINNFLYELQKQPYHIPTEDEIAEIPETEFVVNRLYGEVVKPVIELIQMGRIDEAKETYEEIRTSSSFEPIKVYKKK